MYGQAVTASCVLHLVLNFLIALIVQWVPAPSFQAHTKSISALCSDAQAGCIVTGSSDSLLNVWKLGEQGVHQFYPTLNTSRIRPVDDLQEVEAIGMKGRYPLCLALAKLPQADGRNSGFPLLAIILNTPLPTYVALILAVGSTDSRIHIFTRSENAVCPS